ncbi:hypothetical protein GCM10022237_32970 [Nocardioides ginsengisoli]|uniref:Sulfotransferase family protein n=1 Tax=Nocardioides ginsengisoli TaxID=363868 RepID=A0ABW3W5P5_9ACTN
MSAPSPQRPLVFNHIPKCAGTSARNAIIAALPPDTTTVYRVDVSLVGGYDRFDALRPQAAATFVHSPEQMPLGAAFVTGHVSPGTTRPRYDERQEVTILRAPRLRVLSQWVHSRALSDFDLRHFGHAGSIAFRVARGGLGDYLEHAMIAPNIDNTITRFLTWPHALLSPTEFIEDKYDDELLDAALESLDRFDHVGLVEDPHFLDNLGAAIGLALPETRLNERVSVPRRRRPNLGPELDQRTRELLARRTRLDEQVWAHAARKVLPDADPGQVLDAAWDKALQRYDAALNAPYESRPVRRAAELAYGTYAAARGLRRPWF